MAKPGIFAGNAAGLGIAGEQMSNLPVKRQKARRFHRAF
jgi:hypothetical protein